MSAAAKWMRGRARRYGFDCERLAQSAIDHPAGESAGRLAELASNAALRAAHHATAADALEMLAVVADLLYGLSGDRGYEKTDAQRAALARLVAIGRGE